MNGHNRQSAANAVHYGRKLVRGIAVSVGADGLFTAYNGSFPALGVSGGDGSMNSHAGAPVECLLADPTAPPPPGTGLVPTPTGRFIGAVGGQGPMVLIESISADGLFAIGYLIEPGWNGLIGSGLLIEGGFASGADASISIGATSARDSSGRVLLQTLGNVLDLTTVGPNGLDVGPLAVNTAYYIYIIGGGGVPVAFCVSTVLGAPDFSAPAFAGYSLWRRIGACMTRQSAALLIDFITVMRGADICHYRITPQWAALDALADLTIFDGIDAAGSLHVLPQLIPATTHMVDVAASLSGTVPNAPGRVAPGYYTENLPFSQQLLQVNGVDVFIPIYGVQIEPGAREVFLQSGNAANTILAFLTGWTDVLLLPPTPVL